MKTRTYQQVAQKYARIMGRKDNVFVSFLADPAMIGAATDGRNVVLPSLPPGMLLTDHEALVMNGYLDHETAHLRKTDFPTFVREAQENQKRRTPLKQFFFNVIEDVRIENAQMERYPGCRETLDACAWDIDHRSQTRHPLPENKASLYCKLVYNYLWKHHRHVDTECAGPWKLEELPSMRAVKALLDQDTPKLKSTPDAAALAQKVFDLLPNVDLSEQVPEPPEENEGEQPQGSGSGPGALGGIHHDQPPEQPQPGGEGGQGEDDQHQPDGEDPSPESNPGQDPPSLGGIPNDPFQADQVQPDLDDAQSVKELLNKLKAVEEAIGTVLADSDRKQIIKEVVKAVKARAEKEAGPPDRRRQKWGDVILPPVATDRDEILVRPVHNLGDFYKARNDLSGVIRSMRKMLNIYLRSRDKSSWDRGLEEGLLDQEGLDQLFVGNHRVFMDHRAEQIVNTALEMTVDGSGSMNAKIVRQVSIVLAEALAGVQNLKLEMTLFNAPTYHHYPGKIGGRAEPLRFALIKGFDDDYRKCLPFVGGITTGGSTPLGESYALGMERLLLRPEPKRILWLITDGQPYLDVAEDRHSELKLMEQVYKRCLHHGIQTVGVAIGTDDIRPYVDEMIYIENVGQLPALALKVLKGVVDAN